ELERLTTSSFSPITEGMQGRSFLCRSEVERARLLDMSQRMRRIEPGAVAVFLLFAGFGIPTFGWVSFVLVALGPLCLLLAQTRVSRADRPEYVIAAGWLGTQLVAVPGIALAHGPRVYLLSIFIFPTVLACLVYPVRAGRLATAISAALML